MRSAATTSGLMTVLGVANRLDLPAGWVKREAIAGRIPALRVGRKILLNFEAVERALWERAGATTAKPAEVEHAH